MSEGRLQVWNDWFKLNAIISPLTTASEVYLKHISSHIFLWGSF